MNECCIETYKKILERLDKLRWAEHDKGPDDRLGDNSPSVIAKCYQEVEKLRDE